MNPKPVLGKTPDACHALLVYVGGVFGVLDADGHPDNGKNGPTPDKLHAFQLAEGRVGSEGQKINMTLNSCTSRDSINRCNASAPPTTPYVWAYPLFDSQGLYTVSGQIFPTYYIYENGILVPEKTIAQHPLEDFIKLNAATSELKASDIR